MLGFHQVRRSSQHDHSDKGIRQHVLYTWTLLCRLRWLMRSWYRHCSRLLTPPTSWWLWWSSNCTCGIWQTDKPQSDLKIAKYLHIWAYPLHSPTELASQTTVDQWILHSCNLCMKKGVYCVYFDKEQGVLLVCALHRVHVRGLQGPTCHQVHFLKYLQCKSAPYKYLHNNVVFEVHVHVSPCCGNHMLHATRWQQYITWLCCMSQTWWSFLSYIGTTEYILHFTRQPLC